MIYLKTFESEEAYNAYMAGNPALPNASVVTDGQGHVTGGTHYTPAQPVPPTPQHDKIHYTATEKNNTI